MKVAFIAGVFFQFQVEINYKFIILQISFAN